MTSCRSRLQQVLIDLLARRRLEDYLQTWPHTLLVVSHDRAFLDAVATDIIYQHNERLDYYKGAAFLLALRSTMAFLADFGAYFATPP